MKSCNEIIRNLRIDSDLKQSDIAELIGITQQQYSNYEKGEYELPLRALKILAEHYGVSADYLIGLTLSKEGLNALNRKVYKEYTVGELITDVLSLNNSSRAAVTDYISLQMIRQAYLEGKRKENSLHQ